MSELPTNAELQGIRDADKGPGDDDRTLQVFPVVYTHRRKLLGLLDAMLEANADHDRLVRELDVLINGDGAALQPSLCDIVGQMKAIVRNAEVQASVKQAMEPVEAPPFLSAKV